MLQFNTPARLTTHSWGWFERGWSSAAPWGIYELLLRPACLRILLQCIPLFKLCDLLCSFCLGLSSPAVQSSANSRLMPETMSSSRNRRGGGGASDASVITRCHVKTRKTHGRLVWWTVAGGSAGPQNVYALLSSVTCNPPLPVVQGHTGCFYEMRDEMCLSLHLQLSGFTPSSATKVSQHPEPHALYCWQKRWGLKINWWAALSNFSHISVETSFCQLQLWLSRQKEQRIRQLYWRACMNALIA